MQKEVNDYFIKFGIQGRMENRPVKTLALIRTTDDDRLQSKGGQPINQKNAYYYRIVNGNLSSLVSDLQTYFWQLAKLPIVDETGYAGKIDLEVNAKMSSIADVSRELEKYGLKVIEKETDMEMFILTQRAK